MIAAASFLALIAPVASYYPTAMPASRPAVAVSMNAAKSAASYPPQYIQEQPLQGAQKSKDPDATFGASSSLIDDAELMSAAREAAEAAGHADKFSASQLVIAFNSWKLSRGLTYKSKDEAAVALRTFAADFRLIETHLEAAQSALFSTDAENPLMTADAHVDWRGALSTAAEKRSAAELQRAEAVEGTQAAEDKLRQAMTVASKQEKSSLATAEREFEVSLASAEEVAASERARLARELAQVAIDEKEAREAAYKRLRAEKNEATMRSASAMATAQADKAGAMHKWKANEEQAAAVLAAAEEEMEYALRAAEAAEAQSREAAARKASLIVAAQSEAKALLELLKQSKEEAKAQAAKMEAEKLEMEEKVEIANKRARKAKLAAAAALDDL